MKWAGAEMGLCEGEGDLPPLGQRLWAAPDPAVLELALKGELGSSCKGQEFRPVNVAFSLLLPKN